MKSCPFFICTTVQKKKKYLNEALLSLYIGLRLVLSNSIDSIVGSTVFTITIVTLFMNLIALWFLQLLLCHLEWV